MESNYIKKPREMHEIEQIRIDVEALRAQHRPEVLRVLAGHREVGLVVVVVDADDEREALRAG